MARVERLLFINKAVDKASRVLKRITAQYPKMKRAIDSVNRSMGAFNARFGGALRRLGKFGRKMKAVGRGMTVGLSAPIALAGIAIIRTAVTFQKSMNKVGAITRTIVDGKVTPAFTLLETEAKRLGSTTEFSAGQAADAMVKLGRAGFSATQIMDATSASLSLASATGSELDFAADTVAKTLKQFGLEASEAGRVADVLADISRRTNVDLESLAETFKATAPIAKAYGATLESTAAITGLLGDVGIQGSLAGTALKNIMLKLATVTGPTEDALTALGISIETNEKGMRSVGVILKELGPALAKFPKKAQLKFLDTLFGKRGIAGATALMAKAMKEGGNPVLTMTRIMEGSTGAAREMQAIMQRGAVGAFARFRSALEGAAIAIANSGFLDFVVELTDKLTNMFSQLTVADKEFLNMGVIIAGVAAIFGPFLIILGSFIQSIGPIVFGVKFLIVTLGTLIGSIGAVGAGFAIAIPIIVGGLVFLMTKFDNFGDFVSALVESIIEVFTIDLPNALDSVSNILKGMFDFFGINFGRGDANRGRTTEARAINAAAVSKNEPSGAKESRLNVLFKNTPRGTSFETVSDAVGFGFEVGFAGGAQ